MHFFNLSRVIGCRSHERNLGSGWGLAMDLRNEFELNSCIWIHSNSSIAWRVRNLTMLIWNGLISKWIWKNLDDFLDCARFKNESSLKSHYLERREVTLDPQKVCHVYRKDVVLIYPTRVIRKHEQRVRQEENRPKSASMSMLLPAYHEVYYINQVQPNQVFWRLIIFC